MSLFFLFCGKSLVVRGHKDGDAIVLDVGNDATTTTTTTVVRLLALMYIREVWIMIGQTHTHNTVDGSNDDNTNKAH